MKILENWHPFVCPPMSDYVEPLYPKENTVKKTADNQPPGSSYWKPDTDGCGEHATYEECFRIMRDAKNDGVIINWSYHNQKHLQDTTPCCIVEAHMQPDYYAHDNGTGTKEDIGILREAAEYVLGLKHQQWKKNQKPDPDDMSFDEQLTEAVGLGIRIELQKTKLGTGELKIFYPGSGNAQWRIEKGGYGLKAAIRDVRKLNKKIC